MSISQNIHGFRKSNPEDSFRGWVRVITRARIADHYRETKRQNALIDVYQNLTPSSHDPLSDDSSINQSVEVRLLYERAVYLVNSEFSKTDCEAFHLYVVDGLTAKDIATQLGISVNSVYIAKSRILKRLRDEFSEVLPEYDTN